MRDALGVLQGAVKDRVARVVGGARGVIGLEGEHQVLLFRGEGYAVKPVHRAAVPRSGGGDGAKRFLEVTQGVEACVLQLHVRRDVLQLDLQAHRVAEGAVRVGEGAEEVHVLLA